mgnify:FL=1
MFQCWWCEGEFVVDAPDRETWYTCPHCEIDNEYNGVKMTGTKPTLVQKLNEYNEANLGRYTAKHLRKEAETDQIAIAQAHRNSHVSIGGIIIGSLLTAGLYLPIMLAVYLLGMPFAMGNAKPFFGYKSDLLFDKAEQHFVVIEPRSGVKTPILLVPARGARASWRPARGGGDDFSPEHGELCFGKTVFMDLDAVGASKANQWIP